MKKNMLPLLGIAFIVAIISTGVFYGLFAGKLRSSSEIPGHAIVVAARDLDRGTVIQASDLRVSEIQGPLAGSFARMEDAEGATLLASMKANEPLLEERLTPRAPDGSRTGPVPAGMRAITTHIFQSESVLNMLHAGSRVDLQAVADRPGGVELRTVLENVQVLAVNPADGNGNRAPGAAVTMLIRAQDADVVALADSGSRIRLTLRNPMDDDTTARRAVTLNAVFSGSGKGATEEPEGSRGVAAIWDHPIQLHVQVLSASDAALEQLHKSSAHVEAPEDRSWKASSFASKDDAAKSVESLSQKHELEVVAGERLMAGIGRPISYHAGTSGDRLRVQFSAEQNGAGKLSLHVKPSIGAASGAELQLPGTTSLLLEDQSDVAAKLFPGQSWEHRHMLILVSARAIEQTSSVASSGTHRGR
ncbi:MAG TPA: Flp pilus assembly protein CpaB [Bryobacteraceae bacterium]|nr:Flp pilus assembly protein CpaB [Bryobacteraceae bacterium]